MLVLLSPSKTLDYTSKLPTQSHSQPEFLPETKKLIGLMREKTIAEIKDLMGISDKLATLNFKRYAGFEYKHSSDNSRPAILAFKGDVYEGIETENYNEADFAFAQQHLRILSGLYGLLKPLDLIQPYRLEMGIAFANSHGKNLYNFWGDKITDAINKTAVKTIINLASNEYFKAVNTKKLDAKLINIYFKEQHGKDLKIIGIFAKQARGKMMNFIIKNKITTANNLLEYNESGYKFTKSLSDDNNYVFVRNRK